MRNSSIPLANNGEGKNLAKIMKEIILCNKDKIEKDDIKQTSMMTKIMAAARFDGKIFQESNLLTKINMIAKVFQMGFSFNQSSFKLFFTIL